MTVVIAILKAKPEHTDEVELHLLDLQRRTREEPGAMEYAVHRQDGGGFLVYERYVDQSACDAHFDAPYVANFLDRCAEWLIDAPQVESGRELAGFQQYQTFPSAV